MYSGFPEVGPEQRLDKAEALIPAAIHVSPEEAYARLQEPVPPNEGRLAMLDGRPVYRFRTGRDRWIVYADTGDLLVSVSQAMALSVAARWTGRPATEAHFDGLLRDVDQWTVSGEYAALRPLFRYSWPDGEQLYVSSRTGEVVQYTTRRTRVAAYFGAIPHWWYWTPLRRNGGWWFRFVVWSSALATGAGMLGLVVGCWMYSPRRRYRFRGEPARIPYSGAKRWHMILGLVFGSLACTWSFSGLLSMEPFAWQGGVAAALRDSSIRLDAFTPKPPSVALGQAGLPAKELDFVNLGGRPYFLTRQSAQVSRIVPVNGDPIGQFDTARIVDLVGNVAEAVVLRAYDAYYLDRNGRHPLPALRIRLADAKRSEYYVDLKTAEIVEAYDRRTRWNRWLYHGLHSWDLPWLYRYRPAWDVLVLALLLGGISLSITAVVLGWRASLRACASRRLTLLK